MRDRLALRGLRYHFLIAAPSSLPSGMDSAEQFMAEVRKALAAEATAKPSPKAEKPAIIHGQNSAKDEVDGPGNSTETGKVGEGRQPSPDSQRGADGKPAGNATSGSMGDGAARPDGIDEGMGGAETVGPRLGGWDRASSDGKPAVWDGPRGINIGGMEGSGDVGTTGTRPASRGRSNYHISDPDALFAGGPKARFARNRAAIEAYQSVTDESREPTQAELDNMAAFTGWGSFGQELFQGSGG